MDSHTGPREWHHDMLRLVVLSGLAGLPASAWGQGWGPIGVPEQGRCRPCRQPEGPGGGQDGCVLWDACWL